MRLLLILFLTAITVFGQENQEKYKIFDSNGSPRQLEDILAYMQSVDVVFIGEQHDDKVAHQLQLEILKSAFKKYATNRSVVLSLEMFERDVQVILNEYLKDLITETHFLSSSRAWNNYKTDYSPLVEFAKANGLDVVAANAPRRYVNLVSRKGKNSLNLLSDEAKRWIAPLPYADASARYANKFIKLMNSGGDSTHQEDNQRKLLEAQSLWDATMAFSISESLSRVKNPLIIHVNGAFHSEEGLGIPEHLKSYSPKARFIVITIRRENSLTFDPSKHLNLGDFVILTRQEAIN